MIVPFTKMHSLGNDFMVLDGISQTVYLNQAQVTQLAHRNFGIGFDQLLLIEPPQHPESDFHFRIYNADGSEAGHCGNGARAVAKYVREKGLCWKREIKLSTVTSTMTAIMEETGLITIDMGAPRFDPEQIPLRFASRATDYTLDVSGVPYPVGALSMGNPHCVVKVESVAAARVETLGSDLGTHDYFPEDANVGFVELVAKDHIKLRVFERGVGETMACGTGACAAMVYSRLKQWTVEKVKVSLPGGDLWISWAGDGHSVLMTGPSKTVFEGQVEI